MGALKNKFKEAANSLTQLYKQSSYSYNVAYQQGRQDAFEEVFQWFMTTNNGDFKNVSVNQFFGFMQEKINKQKQETEKAQASNQDFLSQLMPPPASRLPMDIMNNNQPMTGVSNELIQMAADQSLQEDAPSNGGVQVVGKVNLNFSGLKINDSKKRVKQPFFAQASNNESEHDPNHSTDMLSSNEDYDNNSGSPTDGASNSTPVIQGAQDDPTRRFYKAKRMKPQ